MIEERTIEGNKAVFRRYVEEVWGEGDLDFVDEVFAERYISHQSSGPCSSVVPRS